MVAVIAMFHKIQTSQLFSDSILQSDYQLVFEGDTANQKVIGFFARIAGKFYTPRSFYYEFYYRVIKKRILRNKTERIIKIVLGDIQNMTYYLSYMQKCVLPPHQRPEIRLPNGKFLFCSTHDYLVCFFKCFNNFNERFCFKTMLKHKNSLCV